MLATLSFTFLFGFAASAACLPTNNSTAEAQKLADPNYGPVPGQSTLFSTYRGKAPPFPGNVTAPIYPTTTGPPGVDDVVWQNLLSAEWIIFSLYQQAVEAFSTSSFVAAGFPNTTYDRIQEIRDNEAGHLRIFQNQITSNSLKPGACKYQFPFVDAATFVALATVVEISSMAFLTGLVQMAKLPASQGAMTAIAATETRHETWALMDIWKTNPFAGPSDTVFSYANEILDVTSAFVIPESCPKENPLYPSPRQHLPALSPAHGTQSLQPGAIISLNFTDPANQPKFKKNKQYYAVFFHGPYNASVPLDTAGWPSKALSVKIPAKFEARGIIVLVIADAVGAPSLKSVKAGPSILLEQPAEVGLAIAG